MGLFGKRDPISEREKALSAELAALEAQIKKLQSAEESQPEKPSPKYSRPAPPADPVFEPVDSSIPSVSAPKPPPHFYNELGVRKYDLPGAIQRLKDSFKGRPPANPRLVNYLAAGSLQGFRPLRYEKRIARNRFIALTVLLILAIWGILAALARW